ncbi:hypothetical protein KCP76_19050 [Salmonella enterica subsp. enterica serovar Weltevreden]|nr:hypothetical protein KCP76_19050 [Salmonella enterica subsp. enterica serovar Weltevreden]
MGIPTAAWLPFYFPCSGLVKQRAAVRLLNVDWRTSWQIRLKRRIGVGRYGLNGWR